MATKTIQVSADGVNYFTVPGDSGDFSAESASLNDTIFGQDFSSNQSGLITWTVSSNARWRGFAGYCAKVKKSGTPTGFSAAPMTLVSGKTYEISNRAQSVWNWKVPVTFSSSGAISADKIQSIDHLHGRVTFIPSYTPPGAVTATGSYLPLVDFARANSFSLSQTADTTDTTDFATACNNGGFATSKATLLTADLELTGFYRADNDLFQLLTSREEFVVEIDAEGSGLSVARGIYKPITDNQSGDIGGDETETLSLALSVPDGVLPFSWRHTTNTTLPQAIRILQDAWVNKETVYVRYLPEGEEGEGREGEAIVTDISMESSVDGLVEFSVTLPGTGAALVYIPST